MNVPVDPSIIANAKVVVDLDVRPLLERGEEPFGTILAAAARIAPGEALRLHVSFEPVPLYDVLRKRGFAASGCQISPSEWEITFVKGDEPGIAEPTASTSTSVAASQAPAMVPTRTIDVSGMAPPEPMVRILETIEQMGTGEVLRVLHVRRPIHLYPRLDELGCYHETRELEPGRVEILIRTPAAS